jgi:hypothetical protein
VVVNRVGDVFGFFGARIQGRNTDGHGQTRTGREETTEGLVGDGYPGPSELTPLLGKLF